VVAIGDTMTLDRGVLFAKIDDRLYRGTWSIVNRKKPEASLCFICFDSGCSSEPPIHGLLALASRACDDCFHATQRVILLGNNNMATDHPSDRLFSEAVNVV